MCEVTSRSVYFGWKTENFKPAEMYLRCSTVVIHIKFWVVSHSTYDKHQITLCSICSPQKSCTRRTVRSEGGVFRVSDKPKFKFLKKS